MAKLFILLSLFSLTSCATYRATQSNALLKDPGNLEKKVVIKEVPFIKQKENYCGPAALGMMLNYVGYSVTMDDLAKQMYTPKQKGSLPTDVISTTRRHGFLAVPIADLRSILTEVSAQKPVMVFQNLGIKQYTAWHYAVVVGYDLEDKKVILHSGVDKFKKVDIKEFERTWDIAGQWSIVVLPPGSLAETADDLSHVAAAAALEHLGKINEAEVSYLSVLKRWENSLGALIGMGNITFNRKDYQESVAYLTKAIESHPNSAMAWHNLAIAQNAAKKKKEAKESSLKALSLVSENQKKMFEENLKELLN